MNTNDTPQDSRRGSCYWVCYVIFAVNVAAFLIITLVVLVRREFRGHLH